MRGLDSTAESPLFEGAQGRRLMVVDDQEVKDDLIRDMVEVLTSFCARLYGRRAAQNKAKKVLKAIESEE